MKRRQINTIRDDNNRINKLFSRVTSPALRLISPLGCGTFSLTAQPRHTSSLALLQLAPPTLASLFPMKTVRATFPAPPLLDLPAVGLCGKMVCAAAALPAAIIWPGGPPRPVVLVAASALRWVFVFFLLQRVQRLRQQLSRLVTTRAASCEGSRFRNVSSEVELHYTHHVRRSEKASASSDAPQLLLHFNHGFGANAFTWDPLFSELLRDMPVHHFDTLSLAAHDRVGFGLTSRPADFRQYCDDFAAFFGLSLVRSLISAAREGDVGAQAAAPPPQEELHAPESASSQQSKVVLVGHSLGGALSVRMFAEAVRDRARYGDLADRVGALVLIAPALIAPSAPSDGQSPTATANGGAGRTDARQPSFRRIALQSELSKLTNSVVSTLRAIGKQRTMPRLRVGVLPALLWAVTIMSRAIFFVFSSLLAVCVRTVVLAIIFSPTFWRKGLLMAYAQPSRLKADMIARYRWPAQVRGVDRGLSCFVRAAMFKMRKEMIPPRWMNSRTPKPSKKKEASLPWMSDAEAWAVLRARKVPVIIIHGVQDLIVPVSNSRRLLRTLPTARLVEFQGCGHCPQEEMPEELAKVISGFINGSL